MAPDEWTLTKPKRMRIAIDERRHDGVPALVISYRSAKCANNFQCSWVPPLTHEWGLVVPIDHTGANPMSVTFRLMTAVSADSSARLIR